MATSLPSNPAYKPLSKLERIEQLNAVDKSVAEMLQLAHEAIDVLTIASPGPATASASSPPDRKQAFEAAADAYLERVQFIDVHIKRQIAGLEEAGILPHGLDEGLTASTTTDAKAKPTADYASSDARGTGKLEVGWLNSRSRQVDRDMEAELWKAARASLEQWELADEAGAVLPGASSDGDTQMSL